MISSRFHKMNFLLITPLKPTSLFLTPISYPIFFWSTSGHRLYPSGNSIRADYHPEHTWVQSCRFSSSSTNGGSVLSRLYTIKCRHNSSGDVSHLQIFNVYIPEPQKFLPSPFLWRLKARKSTGNKNNEIGWVLDVCFFRLRKIMNGVVFFRVFSVSTQVRKCFEVNLGKKTFKYIIIKRSKFTYSP